MAKQLRGAWRARSLGLVGVLLVLCSSPALAQRTTFNPYLAAQYRYNSNVTFVDEDGPSDSWLQLAIGLPVTRTNRNSTYTLSYVAAYNSYDEFSQLDNLAHSLRFDLSATPSPNSDLNFSLSGTRTQDQGEPDSLDDSNLQLSERSTRQILQGRLRYSSLLARRWRWEGRLGYRDISFEDIDDVPRDRFDEDRSEGRVHLAILRVLNATTSLGISYGYMRFEYEASPRETANTLALAVHRTINDETFLRAELGAAQWSDSSDQTDPDLDNSEYSGYGRLVAERAFRRSRLEFRGYYRPSVGSVGRGASTDTLARLSWRRLETRAFDWGLYVNYLRRDPRDPLQTAVDTYSIGVPLSFRAFRGLRISIVPSYVYQTDVGSYSNLFGAAGIVWYPLEGTRIAGRGS